MLKVTNTLTGKKETFEPLTSGQIKMYVCGPTVYDDIHIGNARSAVNFDTIRKYLIYSGFSVKYVMNITDIDDKIIKKAIDEKKDFHEIAGTYTQAYLEVMKKLRRSTAGCAAQGDRFHSRDDRTDFGFGKWGACLCIGRGCVV
jgi:cysteinyl-tRNA synthetase